MKKLIPLLLAVLLLAGCAAQPAAPAGTQATSQNISPVIVEEEETFRDIISEEEALKIAMEHAGLNTGAVKSSSVSLDMTEEEYEVEIFAKGIEYEYEINVYTGEIIKAEKD